MLLRILSFSGACSSARLEQSALNRLAEGSNPSKPADITFSVLFSSQEQRKKSQRQPPTSKFQTRFHFDISGFHLQEGLDCRSNSMFLIGDF